MVCVVNPESASVFWNLARCNIVLVVPFRVPKVTPFHFVDSQLLQRFVSKFWQLCSLCNFHLDHQVVVFRKKTHRQPATKTCAVHSANRRPSKAAKKWSGRSPFPPIWGAAEGLPNQKPCLVKAGHQLSFRQLVHWRSESAPGRDRLRWLESQKIYWRGHLEIWRKIMENYGITAL